MKRFYRERRIYCGNKYMEVSIFPYSDEQKQAIKTKRRRKEKISEPKQKNLNEKNARNYCVMLANGNFGDSDYVVHLTYDDENLPADYGTAMKIIEAYFRRIRTARKKAGLSALKYICVTQYGTKSNRIHHHVIMNGGLDRDTVEDAWVVPSKKKAERKKIGWANCRRLQPNSKGISQMAGYMAKDSAGKKRFTSSKNLEKPYIVRNDSKYSRKKVNSVAILSDMEFRNFAENAYDGYFLIEEDVPNCTENTFVGWFVNMKFYRKC